MLSWLRAAEAIWDEYGADGYDRVWGGPCGFPLRALTALKAAISVQEPRCLVASIPTLYGNFILYLQYN